MSVEPINKLMDVGGASALPGWHEKPTSGVQWYLASKPLRLYPSSPVSGPASTAHTPGNCTAAAGAGVSRVTETLALIMLVLGPA